MTQEKSPINQFQSYLDSELNSTGGDILSSKNKPIVIGGTDFGRKWNDADAALLSAQMQALGMQQELDIMNYENWYNSPAQQAKRMRDAGLNPDLQGVNSSESASASTPSSSIPSGINQAQFATELTNTITSVMGQALKTYQEMKLFSQQSFSNDISNDKAALEYARILAQYRGKYKPKSTPTVAIPKDGELQPSLISDNTYLPFAGNNRRYAKRVNYWTKKISQFDDYGLGGKIVEDENKYNEGRVTRFTQPLSTSDPDEEMAIVMGDLKAIARDYVKFSQRFFRNQARFNANYYGDLDGTSKARAENSANIWNAYANEFRYKNREYIMAGEVYDARSSKYNMFKSENEYRKSRYEDSYYWRYYGYIVDMINRGGVIGMQAAMELAKKRPELFIPGNTVGFGTFDSVNYFDPFSYEKTNIQF